MLNLFLSVLGLCIPSNNTIFIKSVSEKLATNEPHLTLEFLEECIQGFRVSSIELKHLCLEYMTPWLANLVRLVGILQYVLGSCSVCNVIMKIRIIVILISCWLFYSMCIGSVNLQMKASVNRKWHIFWKSS
jgi:hypothetical protein